MHASFYFQSLFTGHKIPPSFFFPPPGRGGGTYVCKGQWEYEVDSNLIEIRQFYTNISQQS